MTRTVQAAAARPQREGDLVIDARQRYGDWRQERTIGLTVELGGGLDLVPALQAEALTLLDQAALFTSSGFTENPDGSLTTDTRFSFYPAGPVLQAIHHSPTLLAMLRACTGLDDLRPARAGYNFYRSGDHLGIHRDARLAAVTLVADLCGNLPAMRRSPRHARATNPALLELVREGGVFPAGHPSLPVPHDHLRAFDGRSVPHWRPPFEGELGMLATCSFSTDQPA
ncbi:MAG TPA: hypothetical protein VF612_10625 [Jatrophihabitans sp.]|jgi:hypothetical protein|uniref:hypothetical protein n=1 Tax=Jatrophihabitans sp. TaxID=1932789 RepID=UPI002F1872EF